MRYCLLAFFVSLTVPLIATFGGVLGSVAGEELLLLAASLTGWNLRTPQSAAYLFCGGMARWLRGGCWSPGRNFPKLWRAGLCRSLSAEARDLHEWILGPEGQALLAKAGYAPIACMECP